VGLTLRKGVDNSGSKAGAKQRGANGENAAEIVNRLLTVGADE